MASAKRTRTIPKPSIFNRFLAKLQANKEKKEAILPYSKAADDITEIAFADTTYFQKPEGKRELEVLYRNCWAVKKCINVRANLLSFRGLKLVCKSDKAKQVTNDMLKKMHPTRPMLALQNTFRDRSINADIFGNAFDELLFTPKGTKEKPADPANATGMDGFTVVHPINIDLQRETTEKIKFKDNVPVGWVYHRDPQQSYIGGIKLPLARVAHLIYNKIGDEILGMSTMEPIFKTAERMLKIEEGITQGILTHGNPLHDVIVGDESHPPTKKMLDEVAKEVAGLNMKSEYVHPGWIRVGQIESFSLGKAMNYTEPYVTAIGSNFEVPEFIMLGTGEGTNKATAQAMIDFIMQTIEPLQQKQAMYFEENILKPLMDINKIDEVPMVEWNEILPKHITDYANVIKVLTEAMVGDKQIITFEEARELAGLGKHISFKKPTGAQLAETKGMPGIYLVKPHGEKIFKKEKKLIVKAKQFPEMINKALYLVSGNKVYGAIKLNAPKKISLLEFRKLRDDHLITEDERLKWWPDANEFYAYKFSRLKMFDKPKDYTVPKGVQTFLKDVKI